MIETIGITKIYNPGKPNQVIALKDVDVKIEGGAITGFVGPSGCGKTTLMGIVGLLLTATKGRILIGGEDVTSYSDNWKTLFRRKNMGFIYQHINLLPQLTALENAMLPLLCRDISPQKYREKTIELFKKLGILERLNFQVEQLSGGEQQRVAIVRALLTDPEIVIADEPLTFVDIQTAKITLELFDELRREGKAIALSTHSAELLKVADKIYSMDRGLIKKT